MHLQPVQILADNTKGTDQSVYLLPATKAQRLTYSDVAAAPERLIAVMSVLLRVVLEQETAVILN